MYNWSLWLSLAVICYTGSVQSESCYLNSDCNSGKCCRRTRKCAKEFRTSCPCRYNADCKSYEECRAGFCFYRLFTPRPLRTFNFPTWRFPLPTVPDCFSNTDCSGSGTCVGGRCRYDKCVWDSDCSTNNCQDGVCEYNSGNRGAFSWSKSRVLGIVLFGVVVSIVSCLYHVCKRARSQPMPAVRNGNVSAPPTGVTGGTNEHELRPETASTNVLAVEVEDDCPLPPNAPPPYNSLQFESQQNGNVNDFPDQLPPGYDEAVKNSGMPPV